MRLFLTLAYLFFLGSLFGRVPELFFRFVLYLLAKRVKKPGLSERGRAQAVDKVSTA